MIYEAIVRVRYGETDKMGVVYHPNYYMYFEIGRTEFLREMGGMSYKDLEDAGVMMPIIETKCKYNIPAKYDDELTVYTSIETMTVARITFTYKIIRKKDEAFIVEGETSLAFVNKCGRVINMKKHYPELFEKLRSFI